MFHIGKISGVVASRSAAAVLATSSASFLVYQSKKQDSHVECDAAIQNPDPSINLRKRMTAVGRFALKSETISNPSIPTFFVALAGHDKQKNEGMTVQDFEDLWNKKKFQERHDRFVSRVDSTDKYFEPASKDVRHYVKEAILPFDNYREDLQAALEYMLTKKLDVEKQLWEAYITTGELGSSGAISKAKVLEIQEQDPSIREETVVAFRAHHALADGVSLGAAMGDLADESDEIQLTISNEMHRQRMVAKKRLQKLNPLQRFGLWLYRVFGFWIWGSIKAVAYHGYLLIVSRPHPFNGIMNESDEEAPARTVSWCDLAPVDHAKQVAKTLYAKKATLNDLMITCVSFAVSQQLREHSETALHKQDQMSVAKQINVAVPVHLCGGVVPAGEPMGNRIGAMVVRVPTGGRADDRLHKVTDAMTFIKHTPMAYLGYLATQLSSRLFSNRLCQVFFRASNADATVVVSNVRGPTQQLHWNGRPIVATAGFVPLPPGIPIGVVVQSYNGMITLSVAADRRAVPDPDQFLMWMVQEYERLHYLAVEKSNGV